jgi:hypothetical protein
MNRLQKFTRICKLFLILLGLSCLSISLFANVLGIDHDPSWGCGRFLLAGLGVLALLGAVGLRFAGTLQSAAVRLTARTQPARKPFPTGPRSSARDSSARAALAAGLGGVGAILVGLWFITCGTWTRWIPYTQYYDKLASSFLAGQLSLQETPPAQLLALDNPYSYKNREGIAYLWDASLYQGKYYLYWGAVPAVLAAAVKVVLPGAVVDDQYLLFFFYVGLVISGACALTLLRERYFPDAPAGSLLGWVLLVGLSMPVLWLINRPSVYETAIAGGQFFLMLGVCAVLRSLAQPNPSKIWLGVAGLAWGAAVNCRTSLAVAVVFLTVVVGGVVWKRGTSLRRALPTLLWLGLPLCLWASGFCAYNYARFGSIFETGHRYQLTGPAMPVDYAAVISPRYVNPNLYSYLARPLQFTGNAFPFMISPYIRENMWPFYIHLPENYYYSEPVAGIFTAVPAIWLVFLPVFSGIRRGWTWLNERPQPASTRGAPLWVWIFLSGGVLSCFLPLLVFISASMRYLADVLPFSTLLAAMSFWWALRFLNDHPVRKQALSWAASFLVLISIVFGLLTNFSNGDQRLRVLNPALYQFIEHFINSIF